MNFQPYHDNVLVKVMSVPDRTPAGIIIPDQSKDKSHKGEVVAVGPGRYSDKGELIFTQSKPGHFVLFNQYAGTEITVEGGKYLLLKESEIIGRFLNLD